MLPLFSVFPTLARKIPHIFLGTLPTPLERLPGLCSACGRDDLFIKRDDISAVPYGGNKVRKLEFLLAEAAAQGAKRVITSGAIGSNHALATALYARKQGLSATLILFDQPVTPEVRANLLMDAVSGAELLYRERYGDYGPTIIDLVQRYKAGEGQAPYIIPGGGSSPVGALGFVNAGFELKGQIENAGLPEPAAIYVALGTMGTAAGLLLGIRAAGLHSRVIGVRVTPLSLADLEKFTALYGRTNEFLHALDPAFPDLRDNPGEFSICNDYFEPGYGLASKPVEDAVALVGGTDNITLDTTYTGKAIAALIADAWSGAKGPLLFWNTKNSRIFPEEMLRKGKEKMPEEFARVFSETDK